MGKQMVNKLIQGLSYTWPTDYSVLTGTTGGTLIMRGPAALDAAGIISGNRLKFQLTETQTAGLIPGLYFYEVRRNTAAGGVEVIERRRVNVLKNLADQEGGYDGLSENQKHLQAIQAVIAARAAGGTPVRYRIGNRELYQESITDLMALLNHYQRLVDRELQIENGENVWNRKVRFSLK